MKRARDHKPGAAESDDQGKRDGSSLFGNLMRALPTVLDQHVPGRPLYELLQGVARQEIKERFSSGRKAEHDFAPFGRIVFPYHKMGAIDSLDLFGLDELIIFSYYWANRARYRRVGDVGANIGLHSIVLGRCGFTVRSYEPDPYHFTLLKRNLEMNRCNTVEARQAAISRSDGEAEFVRVLGNTTGSHLAGAKDNPYGDLERFPVRVEAIGPLLEWADLLKIDAEGHEDAILSATEPGQWDRCDALVEVGNQKNAIAIFERFRDYGVGLFAQKLGWQRVTDVEQMPASYRDGSLFISRKPVMPWSPGHGRDLP